MRIEGLTLPLAPTRVMFVRVIVGGLNVRCGFHSFFSKAVDFVDALCTRVSTSDY